MAALCSVGIAALQLTHLIDCGELQQRNIKPTLFDLSYNTQTACNSTDQCASEHSLCLKNVCKCAIGFVSSANKTCVSKANLSVKPEHILPIMIVMGVMFLGVCIALNLFSRSRFKKRQTTKPFDTAARLSPSAASQLKQRQVSAQRLPSSTRVVSRSELSTGRSSRAPSAAGNRISSATHSDDSDAHRQQLSRSQCSSRNSYIVHELFEHQQQKRQSLGSTDI